MKNCVLLVEYNALRNTHVLHNYDTFANYNTSDYARISIVVLIIACRERCDSNLVMLVRECVNLHTLVVRERLSTATLLIVAKQSTSLRTLHVRRNAVLLRHDWQTTSEDWDDAFRNMLKQTCKSYDLVEREISRMLGYTWTMMSDAAFKRLEI